MIDDVISIHDDNSVMDDPPVETPLMAQACLPPGMTVAEARFPSSFYAADVAVAFATFKTKGKLTVEHQFKKFFGVSWKSSTFYNHRVRWYNAPLDAREKGIAVGYSDEGCYSMFLVAHGPKNAKLKAAKRKIRASQH